MGCWADSEARGVISKSMTLGQSNPPKRRVPSDISAMVGRARAKRRRSDLGKKTNKTITPETLG